VSAMFYIFSNDYYIRTQYPLVNQKEGLKYYKMKRSIQ